MRAIRERLPSSLRTRAATSLLGLAGLGMFVTALALASGETQTNAQGSCDPHYPDFCIPSAPPDLDCTQLQPSQRNFRAYAPDPHDFDIDDDGIGCEDPLAPTYQPRNLPIKLFAIMAACDSCVTAGPSSPTPTVNVPSPTITASTTPSEPSATNTPANTATPTSTQALCGGASALISGLNKTSNPETVAIVGSGVMTGWYIISESGNQRYDFPANYFLSGSVIIESGSAASDGPPSRLLWTNQSIWNNSEDDDALLYDCTGMLRSNFDDGH